MNVDSRMMKRTITPNCCSPSFKTICEKVLLQQEEPLN